MKRENFYRRDPSKALSGMIGLSLEERGVYNTVIDLLYSTWRPLEDDRAFIAGWCGCAVQKVNPIINRLIEKGRLISFKEGGRAFLSDEAFEAERTAVKGPVKTRSGRGDVGEKSAGVREKSAGVDQNPALLDTDIQRNQPVGALDKRRVEKKEANASSVGSAEPSPTAVLFDLEDVMPAAAAPKAKPWEADAEFGALWTGATDQMRARGKSKENVWPHWRAARAKAGSGAAIIEAIGRYRAKDPDVQRTGGPGLHIWLRDGTWGLWLEQTEAAGPAPATFAGPPGLRAAVVAAKDEAFAVGYLDPCGWQEGPPRRLIARNRFVAEQITKALGAQLVRAGIDVTFRQEQAA